MIEGCTAGLDDAESVWVPLTWDCVRHSLFHADLEHLASASFAFMSTSSVECTLRLCYGSLVQLSESV